MKGSNRKRHRPEEVVAKLRQADEALAAGKPPTPHAAHGSGQDRGVPLVAIIVGMCVVVVVLAIILAKAIA